jgi:transcriptional regulator with XRE-family HTH domain
MQRTNEFLDAVRARLNLTSDYQLAKALKVTRSQVSYYRSRGDVLSDEMAVKTAELLQIDPAYVLTCMSAERTRSERARRALTTLAKKLSGAAALSVLLLVLLPTVTTEAAAPNVAMYIMLSVWLLILLAPVCRKFFTAPRRLSPAPLADGTAR